MSSQPNEELGSFEKLNLECILEIAEDQAEKVYDRADCLRIQALIQQLRERFINP